jgi:hypothetical protein
MNRVRLYLPIILAIGASFIVASLVWRPAAAQEKAKAPQAQLIWEYKVIHPPRVDGRTYYDYEKLRDELNKMGQQGWELTGTISDVSGGGNKGQGIYTGVTLICKRLKQ